MSERRRRLVTAACTVGGAALFAWAVRRAGVAEIADGIRRVGWGLAVVLLLQGVRFAFRTVSWRLCMPPGAHLTFRRAFGAFLAGDAIGSVTPLGLLASEPTKVFLTRHHLATGASVASLAVENLIYAVSVFSVVAVGLLSVLLTMPLPAAWQRAIVGALGVLVGVVALALYLIQRPWPEADSTGSRWRHRLWGVRLAILEFSRTNKARLWRAFGVDSAFHAVAVVEVFLTLRWLLGDQSPTFVQALAFETLNRVVTVAFKFVPFRVGVDEAISGALAPLLAVNPAAGVALAVVRKVRNVLWSGVGLAVIAAHPAQAGRPAGRETRAVPPL